MPKRVLNLSKDQVFLQESAQLSTYACLSHCWGKSQTPTRTLQATVKEYTTKGVPWETLSKTFQDAVDICRRLEIDYLWIDSLCIIQDNDEDWNEEAVKMGDIYAHAFLTIAATKSEDSSGGCYQDRDPAYANCFTIIEGSVYLRAQMPGLGYGYRRDACNGPLLDRAWVLQEMLLSACVIHFTNNEVVWQCSECQWSESGGNDVEYNPVPGRALMTSDRYRVDELWHELVTGYSGLQLSFEKDRLPALAAISQRAAQRRTTDDRFLAGLWMDSLLVDLLWAATYKGRLANRQTGCAVPSWSWVSVQSPVWWPGVHYGLLPCARVVTADVGAIGSPYLGQYWRAELVIEGPVIRTTLGNVPEKGSYGALTGRCWYPDFKFKVDGSFYGAADSPVILLVVAIEYGSHRISALVLRLKDGARTYERIGLLWMSFEARWWHVGARLSRSLRLEQVESYLSKLPREEVIIT